MARMKTRMKVKQRYRWMHTHRRWKIYMYWALYTLSNPTSSWSTFKTEYQTESASFLSCLDYWFGQMKIIFILKICVPFFLLFFLDLLFNIVHRNKSVHWLPMQQSDATRRDYEIPTVLPSNHITSENSIINNAWSHVRSTTKPKTVIPARLFSKYVTVVPTN